VFHGLSSRWSEYSCIGLVRGDVVRFREFGLLVVAYKLSLG